MVAETFAVEPGELDGLPPEKAFLLGVECASFLEWLDAWLVWRAESFTFVCHPENERRLLGVLERRGLRAETRKLDGDVVCICAEAA